MEPPSPGSPAGDAPAEYTADAASEPLDGRSLPIVGIGSSAGGLKALTALLGSAPAAAGFCYVVAQHISPDFDSPLADLLGRACALPVIPAEDGQPLRADVVLVCPPGRDIAVSGGVVQLLDPPDDTFAHPRIDTLLESIAAGDVGERSVAVVLSGTGSDGAAGIRAVNAAGGVTMVEDPASAEFDQMPRAAIATGLVDVIAPAAALGAALARVADAAVELIRPGPGPGSDGEAESGNDDDVVAGLTAADVTSVIEVMQKVTGLDFSEYKLGTLSRQIARRLTLRGEPDVATYRELLARDRQEADALASSFLVRVTGFCRDEDAWRALAEELGSAWAGHSPERSMRIWVAGCSTGEEAYTVAMLAAEVLGVTQHLARRVTVFATDLAEDVLEIARRGTYSDNDVADMPAEWRDRWWRRRDGDWVAVQGLRDAVVFAHHNVASDPPFPRIDLLCLRNTMIYFRESMQKRVLDLCHYALRPGGIVFLGSSERIAAEDRRFIAVDRGNSIYRRSGAPGRAASPLSRPVLDPEVHPRAGLTVHDDLIAAFVPAAIVVDAADDVVEVVGDVSRWCWIATGPHSSHVLALVRQELRVPLLAALVRLREGDAGVVVLDSPGPGGPVRISARALGSAGSAVVTFENPEGDVPPSEVPPHTNLPEVGADDELTATRAALQAVIEDLSASNEELRALNEELQATGEEAVSSSEELEASNEELAALNEALQVRTADLQSAQTYRERLEAAMATGLVVVDGEGRVVRFSAPAIRLFALIEQDLGRPLETVPTTGPIPGLMEMVGQASRHGRTEMVEISAGEHDFLLEVRPYRDNRDGDADDSAQADGADPGPGDGAVLVVTDVTEVSLVRREAARAAAMATAVTDALIETVWQRDQDGRLVFLSRGVEVLFGLRRDHVLAHPGLLTEAVHPEDRDRVTRAAADSHGRRTLEYRIIRSDGAERWVRESVGHVESTVLGDRFTVGTIVDVTEERRARGAADRLRGAVAALMAIEYLGIALLDSDHRVVQANQTFAALAGYQLEALPGLPIESLTELVADQQGPGAPHLPWQAGKGAHRQRFTTKDGNTRIVALEWHAIEGTDGDSGVLVAVHDISAVLEYASDLTSQVHQDSQTGLMSREHFLTSVDRDLRRMRRVGGAAAALWIDLDDFKAVNDNHGHRAGDAVLAQVAERIRECCRDRDAVGRLGGDEFGVVIAGADSIDVAQGVTERILTSVSEPIQTDQGPLFVTASIGIAVAPTDGDRADRLMHNADTAMYTAKQRGGDRHAYFRMEMDDRAKARAEIRLGLSAALRAGQFEMFYQPIISLSSGAAIAAEGLIRWRRGDEVVAAGEFIDVAEQSGLLRGVGSVGRAAMAQDLQGWLSEPRLADLPVALNLSAGELAERDFSQGVLTWEPPGGFGRIIVEVTERSLMAGSGDEMQSVQLLRRLGAHISIDDFGTGFSNLSLLERIEPTHMKIDRTLLVGAVTGDRGRALLAAAVQMAHALGAQVVLEGIETAEQARLAADLGIDFGQGYFYARPASAAEFASWMTRPEPPVAVVPAT